MLKTIKILIFFSLFLSLFWVKIHAVQIHLPLDRPWDDIAISSTTSQESEKFKITTEKRSTDIGGQNSGEKTIFNTINMINDYLWRSFWGIAMILTMYAGYEAITANGDSAAYKKAMRTLIGVGIWLAIAMLSAALVKILVNFI